MEQDSYSEHELKDEIEDDEINDKADYEFGNSKLDEEGCVQNEAFGNGANNPRNKKIQKSSFDNAREIEWEKFLSVDIPEIDELQKRVFSMLNGLINQHNHDDEIVKDAPSMIADLTEYSRYYFSREEEYLRKCGYPDIDCHSKEHRQFIKNTINLRRLVSDDKNNLSYNNVSALRDWLVNHISQRDQIYVPFVRINNYVEECSRRGKYSFPEK